MTVKMATMEMAAGLGHAETSGGANGKLTAPEVMALALTALLTLAGPALGLLMFAWPLIALVILVGLGLAAVAAL